MLRVLRYSSPLLLLLAACLCEANGSGSGNNDGTTTRTITISSIVPSNKPSSVRDEHSSDSTDTSRTINYITHTSPNECLRPDRTVSSSTRKRDSDPVETIVIESTTSQNSSPASFTASIPETSQAPPDGLLDTSSIAPTVSADVSVTTFSHTESSSVLFTSTIATENATPTAQVADPEPDVDSPLDNANFLSFDEWKKQNLAKVGQSPEHVGQERSTLNANRQRPGINNALDTLGEESEIELDFSGFGGSHPPYAMGGESASPVLAETTQTEQASLVLRSKDAGKTCKERTNYASFDCAATTLKSNPECKHASSVLVENKDSYMLNKCSAKNKFIIIELCNDILVDTVVLANYEFFSSVFRHFRVSVSDRYPVKLEKWKDLGTFEARSTRDVQAFLIENPLIWARFLRIEFLTHYGNEYYCPLSLLRVHGTTMMEEFRHQEEQARGESSDDEQAVELEATPLPPVLQEPSHLTDEAKVATIQAIPSTVVEGQATVEQSSSIIESVPLMQPASTSEPEAIIIHTQIDTGVAAVVPDSQDPASREPSGASTRQTGKLESLPVSSGAVSSPVGPKEELSTLVEASGVAHNTNSSDKAPQPSTSNSSLQGIPTPAAVSTPGNIAEAATSPTSLLERPSKDTVVNASASTPSAKPAMPTANSTRSIPASSTASPPPQPSTQESFYKSIHKRLQQLESNSTLSLQYIEEQSRILRDAFSKVEKRQLSSTSTFLSNLNHTVSTELQVFRQAHNQLWQNTVTELEGQREQYQRETLALSARLTLVADELVWQKRMGIVQSTLLLLCLGLVLFARQGSGYMEVPLAQQLIFRSQAAIRGSRSSMWERDSEGVNSPSSPNSRSPVSVSRWKGRRSSSLPLSNDNLTDATGSESRPGTRDGVEVQFQPPTPSTIEEQSDDERADEADEDEGFREDVLTTQSGPATPNGSGAGLKRPPDWPGGVMTLQESAST